MFRYCDSEIAICNKLDLAVRLPKAFFQKGKENNADAEKIMSKSVENYDSWSALLVRGRHASTCAPRAIDVAMNKRLSSSLPSARWRGPGQCVVSGHLFLLASWSSQLCFKQLTVLWPCMEGSGSYFKLHLVRFAKACIFFSVKTCHFLHAWAVLLKNSLVYICLVWRIVSLCSWV